MRTKPIVAALALAVASTQASAVAFAEVRITHITTGFYRSDVNGVPLEDETITSSTDVDLVIVSSLAGPSPNDQWEFRGFGAELAPMRGITYFNEYGYTLTVSDDGLMVLFTHPGDAQWTGWFRSSISRRHRRLRSRVVAGSS